jgi:hypothetical protein
MTYNHCSMESTRSTATEDTPMTKPSSRWWLRSDSTNTVVGAPAAEIYALVSDLPRMGEWSPECETLEWTDGSTGPALDARFVGHNRTGPRGLIRWSRHGRVLVADPGREFAFVTEEGGRESTVWRYEMEPLADGGTRVRESYEVRWIPTWARILDVPTNRVRELRDGMAATLRKLKAAAERSSD